MKSCMAILAGMAMLAATPATACNEPLAGAIPAAGLTPESEQLGQRFAALYLPMDTALTNALRVGASEFRRGVEMGEGGAAWIENNPALYAHLEQATVTALRQCLERRLPDAHVLVANLAVSQLSTSDLRRIIGFYESDSGQALMRIVSETARPPSDLTDAQGNVRDITTDDLNAMISQVPATALTRQQQLAVGLFSRTPAGQRMTILSPQLADIVVSSINGINAQSVPFIERAVIEALAEWEVRSPQQSKESEAPK